MLFYYLPLGASRDLTESQSHQQTGKKGDHSENKTGKSLKSIQTLLLLEWESGPLSVDHRQKAWTMHTNVSWKCQKKNKNWLLEQTELSFSIWFWALLDWTENTGIIAIPYHYISVPSFTFIACITSPDYKTISATAKQFRSEILRAGGLKRFLLFYKFIHQMASSQSQMLAWAILRFSAKFTGKEPSHILLYPPPTIFFLKGMLKSHMFPIIKRAHFRLSSHKSY